MKALISLCALALIGFGSVGCKTPAKQGSSLASFGAIGNIGACKRTKERLVDAYFKKELRRLALKGHNYLFGEAMSGNAAARIVLTAMRLEAEAKASNPNAKVTVEMVLGIAEGKQPSEADVKKFIEIYERNGTINVRGVGAKKVGLIADSVQLERGTKGTLATLKTSLRGPTANQARFEIKEMMAERTEMLDKITQDAVNKAANPKTLKENLRLVEGLSKSLAAEISGMNKGVPANQHVALAEIAANEISAEVAKAAVSGTTQISEMLSAKVKSYANAPEAVRRSVTIKTFSAAANIEAATGQPRSKRLFEAVTRLYPEGGNLQASINRAGFAELVVLEGVMQSAVDLGDNKKLENAKRRIGEVMRAMEYSNERVPNNTGEMKSFMEKMARTFESTRRFNATNELSEMRTQVRRNNKNVRRNMVRH